MRNLTILLLDRFVVFDFTLHEARYEALDATVNVKPASVSANQHRCGRKSHRTLEDGRILDACGTRFVLALPMDDNRAGRALCLNRANSANARRFV